MYRININFTEKEKRDVEISEIIIMFLAIILFLAYFIIQILL